MYIPQIKEKYSLVDLARFGTRARKHIHSDVLIGGHPPVPMFKEGDILDGNATFNLIQCAYDQDRVYKMVSQEINEFETNVNNVVENINNGYEDMSQKVDNAVEYIRQSAEDLNNRHTSDVEQINTSLEQVTNDINQCQSDLQETKAKHDQDIQEVYEYIEDNRTMVVYDGLEENLLVYNIKHG